MAKVFISGGTGSIGRALVSAFAAADYDVLFQYHLRSEEAAILESSTGAKAFRADYTNPFVELPADVDVLINNAGVNVSNANAHNVSDDDWHYTLAVNLHAPFLLTRLAIPFMVSQTFGRVINIGSIYSLEVSGGNLPYSVSKHGLSALTKTVAQEYGPFGITCNEICPGPVESDLMHRIAIRRSIEAGDSPNDYFDRIRSAIPTRRLVQPSEVAELSLFIASKSANSINGSSFVLDGGMSL